MALAVWVVLHWLGQEGSEGLSLRVRRSTREDHTRNNRGGQVRVVPRDKAEIEEGKTVRTVRAPFFVVTV